MLMVLYLSLILLCTGRCFAEMPVAVVYCYTDVLVPSSCSGREWRMWRCCRRSWSRSRPWWTIWHVRGRTSMSASSPTTNSCRPTTLPQRWEGQTSETKSNSAHFHVEAKTSSKGFKEINWQQKTCLKANNQNNVFPIYKYISALMSQQLAECLISLIKDLWIILHFNPQPCKVAL